MPDHQITSNGVINNNNQQPRDTNQGPGLTALTQRKVKAGQWTHNPKLGYKSTQGQTPTWRSKLRLKTSKGTRTKEKLQDLMEILKGTRGNPPRQPSKMRIDGMDFFRVPVSNQNELRALLGGVVETPSDTEDDDDESQINEDERQEEQGFRHSERVISTTHLFERIDQVAERKHDMARSIELYGLPARVNMELLRLAANQLGDVENIKLRACARGVKPSTTKTAWAWKKRNSML
ncbi:hypothetical protein B0O80DRAFT_502941 [Mortierella sp. GBAus27b]|nr:hypothetical protein B0O80DRAFT_502941 [Mortierella sp. GBAus27b]